MEEILFELTDYTDTPHQSHIEWLTEHDTKKFNEHLILAGQEPMHDGWLREIYQQDLIRYCLLYHNGLPVARGAVEPYSKQAWEAADIRTAKTYRGKGFAKEILRFLSSYILEQDKTATWRTEEDNKIMQTIILSIGYKEKTT